MRGLLATVTFCLFMLTGYLVSVESWNGTVFVYLGELRSPSAVRSIKDYSAVDRTALFASVHRQMIAGAHLIKQPDSMGLTLGHPLMKSATGRDFACAVDGRPGLFDHVELTFIGLGISEAGRQPKMTIEADCRGGGNLSELGTIWIPMREIVAANAQDQELQIYGENPVTVRLEQIPGEWPATWVLWNVRLFREDNPEESLVIDSGKIRESGAKMLSFDWTAAQ